MERRSVSKKRPSGRGACWIQNQREWETTFLFKGSRGGFADWKTGGHFYSSKINKE